MASIYTNKYAPGEGVETNDLPNNTNNTNNTSDEAYLSFIADKKLVSDEVIELLKYMPEFVEIVYYLGTLGSVTDLDNVFSDLEQEYQCEIYNVAENEYQKIVLVKHTSIVGADECPLESYLTFIKSITNDMVIINISVHNELITFAYKLL